MFLVVLVIARCAVAVVVDVVVRRAVMGRGSCRRDPLLWGWGEEVDGSRHEKNMEKHDTCTSFYCGVHTLALCTLT